MTLPLGLRVLLTLLTAYAITFALQNDKVPGVRRLFKWAREQTEEPGEDETELGEGDHTPPLLARLLGAMIRCTFCTGFHAGWMAWLLVMAAWGPTTPVADGTDLFREAARTLILALVAAGTCYAADEATAALERAG